MTPRLLFFPFPTFLTLTFNRTACIAAARSLLTYILTWLLQSLASVFPPRPSASADCEGEQRSYSVEKSLSNFQVTHFPIFVVPMSTVPHIPRYMYKLWLRTQTGIMIFFRPPNVLAACLQARWHFYRGTRRMVWSETSYLCFPPQFSGVCQNAPSTGQKTNRSISKLKI